MTFRPTFEPITPKRDPFKNFSKNVARATAHLATFLLASQAELQRYPPQSSSSTYQRSGKLGQAWTTKPPRPKGRDIEGFVGNKRSYAIHVQGPPQGPPGKRQVRWAKRRGWPSVTSVSKKQWKKFGPKVSRALQGKRI